ncbi:conserved oligomeric Golgi complex subunit 8-like [Dreissena polymorpha]|uniref:Conserved oligomeric Golgi complex subunit 8 n=1 Tax=Dreissena polymorpha TaxID=45954 RepID=A0A9D4H8V7_DREPO|nr:conserved oligomeric Golgi complex subunit 8-like [Dreissena polymorpha]KAH3831789.1 hypothetical protein DPMN_105059 [Dreissena polymorpha]
METVDVEEESILTAIFKDAFPESWQSDPQFVQYLSELSSYGVDKLAQEPERLREEKCQVLEQTQNLAFKNYNTFIHTAECSREIFQDFQIIESHVGELLEKLPVFSTHCSQVLKKAQDITTSRRMNSMTLTRHTQLLEILELPQLMDTCVRNGYYDEALELAAHVKRLEKKHSNIPVIASIVGEVKISSQLMLNQLIQQLRTNIQLPGCLRVIGYLRRMDVFTEVELRIKFLQARDSWFQTILDTIPKQDAYTHITKTIEASRVHMFDIITQYRAIFSDEDPLLSTSKHDTLNEGALFHTWIVQKVSQFLSTLEADLVRGVGGRLDSILGQCMYFGLSFSRVGADFRALLPPIFQQAALNGLKQALHQADIRFEETMRSYSLLSGMGSVSGLPYTPSTQAGQLYPPTVLLEFTPLAAYCNDILSALNELRLCAPIAMVTSVTEALQSSYGSINKVILAFHRAEETTFDSRERSKFAGFCAAYSQILLPYINKCLQALYPPTQLAQALGITVSEMNKMGHIGRVDIAEALKSLRHIMPDLEVNIAASDPITENQHENLAQTAENERPGSAVGAEIGVLKPSAALYHEEPSPKSSVKEEDVLSGAAVINQISEKVENFSLAESDDTIRKDHIETDDLGISDVADQAIERSVVATDEEIDLTEKPDVKFSLDEDTEEEIDLNKIASVTTEEGLAASEEVVFEATDTDTALAALANDVLHKKD